MQPTVSMPAAAPAETSATIVPTRPAATGAARSNAPVPTTAVTHRQAASTTDGVAARAHTETRETAVSAESAPEHADQQPARVYAPAPSGTNDANLELRAATARTQARQQVAPETTTALRSTGEPTIAAALEAPATVGGLGDAPAALRRPGLDLHAALSGARVSRSAVALTAAEEGIAEPRGGTQPQGPLIRTTRIGPLHAAAEPPRLAVESSSAATAAAPAARPGLQLARVPASLEHPAPVDQPPAPPVQRSVAAPPDAPAPASVQRVNTFAGEEHAPRERLSEAPDDDLEELAARLYEHIRARFRAELLIDRERAGLLADRY
ncbi:MAG: hypothetical protein ACJ77E_10975 [Gaiellaceae bacterium]